MNLNSQIASKQVSKNHCMLCSSEFNLKTNFLEFLTHLCEEHDLFIHKSQEIDYFERYVEYWRQKFSARCIDEIISPISLGSKTFFLLSAQLKEDQELRHKLALERMLKVQEFERSDVCFKKQCLFCKVLIEGKRAEYCNHLSEAHNLRLGNPLNLVYIDEFINQLEKRLKALQCLCCTKIFPDRSILLEHMRKKFHKKINPYDKQFDKFYAVNYLEIKEDNFCAIEDENPDSEYEDWKDRDEKIKCLFCKSEDTDINCLKDHMKTIHTFDFSQLLGSLDFYQRVKAVNYIRKQIDENRCIFCDASFENDEKLLSHLKISEHFLLPEVRYYDKSEFFFPTYQNDCLLTFLEEITDE